MTQTFTTDYYNYAGAQEFLERLRSSVLLMQGPMGSVLQSQLGAADIPPAFWNSGEPQTVERIHQLYVSAGAEVALTNTFQASAPALEQSDIAPAMSEVNRAAVDEARRAMPSFVWGSIGHVGLDWFVEDSPEYRACRAAYREQAYALLNAGVDALMLETFVSIRDLEPALAGVNDVSEGMPVLVSFAIDDAGNLFGDGLTIEGAIVWAEKRGASAVGVNCCSLEAANNAVPRMLAAARTPIMVRPNAGKPDMTEDGPVWSENPEAFAKACVEWAQKGAHMVGSCCGTTPITTAAMADALQDI